MIELSKISRSDNPEEALAAVVALRRLADKIEREAVCTALHQGAQLKRLLEISGEEGVHAAKEGTADRY